MDAGRVLVIAPDLELRDSVAFSLGAHGYQVVAVSHMQDAGTDDQFDCFLIDEPALGAASDAWQSFGAGKTPVLLMAYSQAARGQTGFQGIVDKPLRGEDVVQAVFGAISAKAALELP